MNLPRVLFKGKYNLKNIETKFSNTSNRKINLSLESKLQKEWKQILREVTKRGIKAWDSNLYRLDNFEAQKDKLSLTLSTIPFSISKSMNRYLDNLYKLGEDYFSKSLFTESLIKTSDNKYVFGKLTTNYLTSRKIDLIGGVLSKDEQIVKNGKDVFKALFTEFKEEINISEKHIKSSILIGTVLTPKTKVGLIFDTCLSISSRSLIHHFKRSENDEIEDLILVDKIDLMNTIDKTAEYRTEIEQLLA